MDSDKQPHSKPRQNNMYSLHTRPSRIHLYSTQLELQIDITLPMNINPKIIGLTFDPKLTYNKHIEITTTKARKTIQILKALTHQQHGGNDHRNIQSHNKTHTRVRFHHMVTTSIRHKHQQTTDNIKHRTQNSNWVHNIYTHHR